MPVSYGYDSEQYKKYTDGSYQAPTPAPATPAAPAPATPAAPAPATPAAPTGPQLFDQQQVEQQKTPFDINVARRAYQGGPLYTPSAAALEGRADVSTSPMVEQQQAQEGFEQEQARVQYEQSPEFRLRAQGEQLANFDPSQWDFEDMPALMAQLDEYAQQLPPEAFNDPKHPMYDLAQRVMVARQQMENYASFGEQKGVVDQLMALARGEGVEDLASVKQHEESFDRAGASASSALGGAVDARGQALLQARQAALGQQEARQREMLIGLERLSAAEAASKLTSQLQSQLTEYDFANEDLNMILTQAENSLDEASKDAEAMVKEADLLAAFREKQAREAEEASFNDALLSSGAIVLGTGIGAMFGAPMVGGMVAGAGANALRGF